MSLESRACMLLGFMTKAKVGCFLECNKHKILKCPNYYGTFVCKG